MQFFEYPYVIISILAFGILLMGAIGLYFTVKSAKAANGTVEKTFCSIGKLENDFEKAVYARKQCSVIYVSIVLDGMKRIYPESRAKRMYEQMRSVLLKHFSLDIDGEISIYDVDDSIAFNFLKSDEIPQHIDNCFEEINDILTKHSAINVVKINFGYFCTSSNDVTFKVALSRAKRACSMAEDKDVLYCRWDSSNGKEFERKIKIENNIENEIDNNRFYLVYQPILDSKNDKIIGAEVLSRLNSESEGVLTPRMFLGAVNNVGLNEKFDYYILEKNIKWISNDKAKRGNRFYTINFSRQTLCDSDLAKNIIETIEKYGIDFSSIAVEILEDKGLKGEEKSIMINNLAALKKKGILILLDDFGKGYTSFVDLAEFAIDIVKIDKSIIQNANSPTGFVILKNIIQTAHDLGFKTLCEGIETEEHKAKVVEAGCDMFQGFYFYRPMQVAKFETLFDEQ